MSKKPKLDLDTSIAGAMDAGEDKENLTSYSDDEIEAMFEDALNNYPESAFLESIYDKWRDTGELTTKQWQGLQNSVRRVRAGH